MGLTAVAIKAAKGRDKQYKLADSGGLHLLVLPSGQRYWRMNYRYLGKYKTLAFGVWPDVELADARSKRDEARRALARGVDPAAQIKLDKITASIAAANTFQAVADEWYTKTEKEGLAPATLNKNRWLLGFANQAFGNRPVAEILPHELLALLRKLEARGRHDSAKRLRSICGQVFRYAIATARANRDISTDLRGALISVKVTHRAAITTPAEVGALLLPAGMSRAEWKEQQESNPAFDAMLRRHPSGVATVIDTSGAAAVFAQLSPPDQVAQAMERLVAEPDVPRLTPLTLSDARYGSVPRHYIECLQDRAIPIADQRRMQVLQPCASVTMLDCDHSPFLSAPDQLAQALLTIARGLAA